MLNRRGLLTVCAATALSVWAVTYILRAQGQTDTVSGFDLHLRWVEQQYVLRARDPFRVVGAWRRENPGRDPTNLAWNQRDRHEWHVERPALFRSQAAANDVEPDLGPPAPGYPPWAYFTGLLLVSAPWPAAYWWYLLVSVASALTLSLWIWKDAANLPGTFRLLLIGAVLAAASLRTTLRFGQYGLIVSASLAAALLAMRDKRSIWAGILFAIAMTKPTMAAPFLLIPLVRRDWKAIVVATGYLIGGSLFVWAYTGTDPVSMLKSMVAATNDVWLVTGANPIRWLRDAGMNVQMAVKLCAVIGIGAALVLMHRFRDAPLDVLFAIAAVVSRFWTYHKSYDDVILIFVLVPVARAAFERHRAALWLVLMLLGVSLWVPSRLEKTNVVFHAFQCATWIGSLVVLLWSARERASEVPVVSRPQGAIA